METNLLWGQNVTKWSEEVTEALQNSSDAPVLQAHQPDLLKRIEAVEQGLNCLLLCVTYQSENSEDSLLKEQILDLKRKVLEQQSY